MSLQGKVALVTGAGNGIGEAIATALAEAGATVACADINPATAQATAAKAAAFQVPSMAIEADCGDVASINSMVEQCVTRFGQLDIIVNNAGVTRSAYIMDLTEADWDRMHRINAKGVFFSLQAAARQMIAQGHGGRIINIASIAGRGYKDTSNTIYAGTKGAVMAITRHAARGTRHSNWVATTSTSTRSAPA